MQGIRDRLLRWMYQAASDVPSVLSQIVHDPVCVDSLGSFSMVWLHTR